jgi:hypothetical protein
MRLPWLILFQLLAAMEAAAQEFRDIKAGIDGVGTGFGSGGVQVSFGDFDGDGDLDVLTAGMGQIAYSPVLKVYRNDNGRYSLFTDFSALKDSLTSAAAWADMDKDGRVELVTWVRAGGTGPDGQYRESGFARVYSYRPSGNAFEPAALALPFQGGMTGAAIGFADVDLDGYPDLFVSGSLHPDGMTHDTLITSVFRNGAGRSLTEITGSITPVTHAVAAWKDIDNDGDLDLFLAGAQSDYEGPGARIYKFDGTRFVPYSSLSTNITVESADWGDYDDDGRPDLVVCGSGPSTKLFRNTGSGFSEDSGRLKVDVNAYDGSVAFGDVDGDGDPDLVVMGENTKYSPSHFTLILQNDDGDFYDLGTKLPPYWYGKAQFTDFDKDGQQDLVLCGTSLDELGRTLVTTALYRNIRGDFGIMPAQIDSISGKRPRWGDFDGDRDLDLFACGAGLNSNPALKNGVCRMYRNDAGTFVRQPTPMDGLNGEPELADFDGDGRLDVLLAVGGDKGLRLFRNTGSDFQEAPLQITGADPKRIQHARVGDFDGDGDADLAVWGSYNDPNLPYFQCYSGLLRNDGGGTFTETDKGTVPSLCDGEMEWGDYDRDGDQDLLFAGDTAYGGNNVSYTGVYRNDAGAFVQTQDRFPGISGAQVRWGDFDKDGDLDFAVAGASVQTGVLGVSGQNVPTTIVYRLVGGRFEEFFRPDYEVIGDVAWIDYDNDGDLDLIVSGRFFSGLPPNVDFTLLYRNNGLTFTLLIPEGFYLRGALDVGDFDNDGDQDFVASGSWMYPHTAGDGTPVIRIYRNSLTAPNLVPTAPPALRSALGPGSVSLSWGASADAETPADALHYNLRVGTSPGAGNVAAPASLSSDGYRLIPVTGNAGHIRSAALKGLAQGTYYWSVQGVDQQMGGSPFAAEQTFTLGVPAPVLLSAEPGPGPGGVTLRWNRIAQANFGKYYLHYGTAAEPSARLDSLPRAGDTVFTVTGLENGKTYHFRLSAADLGGNASGYSAELTALPDGTPPAVPDPVTAVPGDRSVELSWKENTESDFLCYLVYQRNASGPIQKIDSITDIHATAKRISGLKNGTPYSFLVAAVDKVQNHSGFSAEAVAIPSYLITPSGPEIAFGKLHIGSGKDTTLRITNASDLPVIVDSVRFVNAAFSLQGSLASLPAKAETTLTFRFLPGKPAGGDFAGALKLYYGGAKVPLEIGLSGRATALPYCRIDKIAPKEVLWDTATVLSFLSSANDSDNAGEGDRITAYLWSSSLAGAFGENASGFLLKPSQLGIGKHAISLRVVDNEGDTSLAATADLDIKSRKPLARVDSITPKGLIIRGADAPRFRCTAYDLDEGAGPSHDGLSSFALFSTLQGRITSSKDTALDPSALSPGLHGFYAVAVDDEGDTTVSDTAWVPVQTGIGMALVVAGTDFDDNRYFYENIAPNCNWVYSKLRQRGFTDSLITYFNPVGWQSIGGAYHENSHIVDETEMTRAKLRERILAYGPRVRNGVPLVLSLIGHGSRTEQNGKFYLSPAEFVTADTLNAWLDSFNRDSEGHVTGALTTPIALVLDFCYSGTFLAKLRSSSQNRILISSSSADKQAYFQNGQSFSYAFFRQIGKGGNLAQAWAAGKAWSDANTAIGQDRANPLADADNDNLPNESEDLALMTQIYIGGSQQDQSPDVHWKDVRLDFIPGSQSLSVRAFPEGAAPVDTAWFTLLAPDFDYASGAADPFASLPLKRQPDGSFAGSVKLEPVLSGDYLAIVYGLSGGEELMPAAKRCQTLSTLVRRLGTPLRFDLGQNFPNPALRNTYVPFALTRRSKVSLAILDMRGRVVRTLADGVMTPGFYTLQWDGRDAHGMLMPSGMYTYSLVSGEGLRRRKLVWGG